MADEEKPREAMASEVDSRLPTASASARNIWSNKPLPPMPRRDEEDDLHLEYLREHPSAALPPSPLSPNSYGRPRAPTPSASVPATATADDHASPVPPGPSSSLSSLFQHDSPVSSSFSSPSSPLLRSVSESQVYTNPQPSPSSFARPPKPPMPLPDPSQYPDPYPFRPPHHHLTNLPALSYAGSSSTRSSAYTSSGSALASGDYGHVHVASGDDDTAIGVGITSDAVVQLLNDSNTTSSSQGINSRMPIDQSRWSESYSTSSRSRSSSVGNNNSSNGHDTAVAPRLQQKPSYDMGWQAVDERDEAGMSEEETDDDHHLGEEDGDDEEKEEERTSAIVIAEEGRGLIVHGDNVPIVQLHVQPGTTHLLIGSSSTPNAMPGFLTTTLPQICNTLLALDISANFLGALPPILSVCQTLEELNIASNPLRVLPVFLAELTNLRVIIADSTGINTLPDTLVGLEKLHTMSVRRNKLHALPSWLCLLPALQTLCVDGNPFQGPWRALVEPLLAKVPMSPMYPPSTPMFPLSSASIQGSMDTETDEDLSDSAPPSASADEPFHSPEEEDHTITPERAPFLSRSATSPVPDPPLPPQPRGLTRTRTTPNRAHFNQSRAAKSGTLQPEGKPQRTSPSSKKPEDSGYFGDHEVRKMKSAGDLRRGKPPAAVSGAPAEPTPSPPAPVLANYSTSLSSSNLLNMTATPPERPVVTKRFASLGPTSVMGGSPSRSTNGMRPHLTRSLWDNISENEGDASPHTSNRMSSAPSNSSSPPHKPSTQDIQDGKYPVRTRSTKDGKEKGSRWGFLKKMSMGKMRIDSPSPAPYNQSRTGPLARPHTSAGSSPSSASASPPERFSKSPQIDMRFSTAGILDSLAPNLSTSISPPQDEGKPIQDMLKVSPAVTSPTLLAPPSPLPRTAKRRSFLPIDAPGTLSLNIPIPDSSAFVPGLTAMDDGDDAEPRVATPSPVVDSEQYLRREEERARESYMRALRSVMAYLKDMNDLGLSQQSNPISMYGAATDDVLTARSRRPTMIDGHREVSMALSGSTAVSMSDSNGQLRSTESIAGLRSGSSTQTLSVATTDSSGSSEERKFKDDKGKRAMVVREIVVTERTYVKGLQELVDIYIKPGCVPVNLLSGVGSTKDTVVPASERKVVFGGIDALFSFHKDSFLPALEIAAAPLMRPSAELQQADADGQLSLSVVKAVGSMFLKHAAFMRMYSSYINNFDSSVQRVKYWTADRQFPGNASPAASAISPSSSTAQLVGLGLSMSAISAPNVMPEGGPTATGVPNLTTSQRRRIKTYLKRCRMNPRHSQLNLEGYLLLPVQRIPRYRLLLEELLRSTPPAYEYMDDPLDRALAEISSLANNMNEGKRESESRRKLVQWQARIRGKFPSPLVQPHRRLIMDGPLLLTRVVRKAMVSFEAINGQGDASTVQVDCLAPELTPRPLVGILCNDLLVLCRDPSEGQDPTSFVDLWAVLRMQTLPQPASIVHGNALRLVDNKAILYFDAPSSSDALNWYRAINLHIPASKT